MEVKNIRPVKGNMLRFTLVAEGVEISGIRTNPEFTFLLPPATISNGKVYSSVIFPLEIQPTILSAAKAANLTNVATIKCSCGETVPERELDAHYNTHHAGVSV